VNRTRSIAGLMSTGWAELLTRRIFWKRHSVDAAKTSNQTGSGWRPLGPVVAQYFGWLRSRTSGMQGIVLCLLLQLAIPTPGGAQLPGNPQELGTARAVSVLLAPQHPQSFRLPLTGLDAASIVIDAAVPDVSYKLSSADGVEILSGHLNSAGWATIPFSTVGLNQAQLELRTESPVGSLPGFHAHIDSACLRQHPCSLKPAPHTSSRTHRCCITL
jgi:hypothetical protein